VGSAGVAYSYDKSGAVTRIDRTRSGSFAGYSEMGYGPSGSLARLTHYGVGGKVLAAYEYVYDLADQLAAERRGDREIAYGYDAEGQLTSADFDGQPDQSFAYDAGGNRTVGGEVVGPHNRLERDGRFAYGYDAEGNLVGKTELATGEVTEYTYDYNNRLVRAERHSAGGVLLGEVRYRYDTLGRLIEREVNGTTLYTVYDGVQAWADFGGGELVARYLSGGVDDLVTRWRASDGLAWYLTDAQGTVRDIADAAGLLVVNHVEYGAFGEVLSQSNPASGDRFLYTGREWEPELGLYYYRARFYDPATGRFTSQDPIGFEGGTTNLYDYVGNSPSNAVDPSGLTATTEYVKKQVNAATGALARCLGKVGAVAFTEAGVYVYIILMENGGAGIRVGESGNLAARSGGHGQQYKNYMRSVGRYITQALPNFTPNERLQVQEYLVRKLENTFKRDGKSVTIFKDGARAAKPKSWELYKQLMRCRLK
jgi:RHS repeat-associated protein